MNEAVTMSETAPLLDPIHRLPSRTLDDGPLVDFDPKGDSENPLDWSGSYKHGIVFLLSLMAFTVSFTCIGVVPVADKIVQDLGGGGKSASILLVTIWELGEAAGPLLMAPMSEIYGRYPVFNIANILFILGVILGAVSQTTNLFIFSRFLTGFAVASNVLNPAIIGDIYVSESRGSGMSLLMLAPLVGGTVGPAIGGVLAEKMGWRTILWLCAGVAILCEVLFFAYLRETYKVTILQRKAARLREEMNDDSLKCAWEVEDGGLRVWWQTMRSSFARPLVVMWSSGVLKVMSFYGGFVFTFYYIMATSLSGILKDNYGFSPSLTGSAFIFFSLGAIGGILVCNKFIDRIYINLGKTHSSTPQPEYRLPFMIVGAVCLPPVIWLYGWAPDSHWPVWLLFMSVGLSGVSLIICSISLSSYIVDAFGLYSASAMTMILLVRCLMGTLLPLAIPPLTEEVGLGYAFLILAAACVAVIPLPIVMMRYGRRWRQKSAFTRDD